MQKSMLYGHTDRPNTIDSIRMHQNLPFFNKNLLKMAVFWSKMEFSGLRQAFEDRPPYLEGAGCE